MGTRGSGGAAIFVKTPGLSPVKTRLAAGVGAAAAERFYVAAAEASAAAARAAGRRAPLHAYFAVAEPEGLAAAAWQGLPRLGQGAGALGDRLHAVYAALLGRHDYGLLLGADAPQLEAETLCAAAAWLGEGAGPRFVLGRAEDGGFWLFGGNAPLAASLWQAVPYSHADTYRTLRDLVAGQGALREVGELRDVDRAEDLAPLAEALRGLAAPLPEQRRLLRLVEKMTTGAP